LDSPRLIVKHFTYSRIPQARCLKPSETGTKNHTSLLHQLISLNKHTHPDELVTTVEDQGLLPTAPLLSVVITAYNHEDFIVQAIESALEQKTDFDYEIIVAEDKSTDSTSDIVLDFQRCYPEKVRLRLAQKNLYSQGIKPWAVTFPACRGKYIALLEGDDFWTDPLKLQKQVDLLEKHPKYAGCYHPVRVINDTQVEFPPVYPSDDYQRDLDFSSFMRNNHCQTCSVVFRANLLQPYPAWMLNVMPGDWAIYLHLTQHGSMALVSEKMAIYRIHAGGTWSVSDELSRHDSTQTMFDTLLAHADFSAVGEQCHDIASILRGRIEDEYGSARVNRAAYRRLFRQHALALLRSGNRKNNIKTLFA
jgi:glycosyltransferase involved in cell wall biosynthesis